MPRLLAQWSCEMSCSATPSLSFVLTHPHSASCVGTQAVFCWSQPLSMATPSMSSRFAPPQVELPWPRRPLVSSPRFWRGIPLHAPAFLAFIHSFLHATPSLPAPSPPLSSPPFLPLAFLLTRRIISTNSTLYCDSYSYRDSAPWKATLHCSEASPLPACPGDQNSGALHLYKLTRGLTPALISAASFSSNGEWLAVSSGRGTTHIFHLAALAHPASQRPQTSRFIRGQGHSLAPTVQHLSPACRLRSASGWTARVPGAPLAAAAAGLYNGGPGTAGLPCFVFAFFVSLFVFAFFVSLVTPCRIPWCSPLPALSLHFSLFKPPPV